MASTDPLLVLRTALSNGHTIEMLNVPDDASPATGAPVFEFNEATHFVFPSPQGKQYFPKTTSTRFRSSDGTYALQTLLFAFINSTEPPGVYMKKSNEHRTGVVPITERKIITEWLAGRSAVEGPDGAIIPLEGAETSSTSPTKRPADSEPSSVDASASAGKKQRYTTNKADIENVKTLMSIIEGPAYATGVEGELRGEKTGGVFRNRETVLRGERFNSFESAKTLVQSRLKLTRAELAPGKEATATTSTPAPVKSSKKKSQHPIIIISPSSTALLTMHNVKRFLEESIFMSSDEARRDSAMPGPDGIARGGLAMDFVTVDHARSTSTISSTLSSTAQKKVRFYVVDGVEALMKLGGVDAWDRVVCVMTTGQEWQFRPYKWQEPKELFHHVKGIFMQWTTDPVNSKVRGWNVTELRVDPTKRHIDKSTVADFWRHLEGWMSVHTPHLLP